MNKKVKMIMIGLLFVSAGQMQASQEQDPELEYRNNTQNMGRQEKEAVKKLIASRKIGVNDLVSGSKQEAFKDLPEAQLKRYPRLFDALFRKGRLDLFALLVDAGANVNIKTPSGIEGMFLAGDTPFIAVARKLMKTSSVSDQLDQIIDSLEYLLLHGANPDLQGGNGESIVDLLQTKKITESLRLKNGLRDVLFHIARRITGRGDLQIPVASAKEKEKYLNLIAQLVRNGAVADKLFMDLASQDKEIKQVYEQQKAAVDAAKTIDAAAAKKAKIKK